MVFIKSNTNFHHIAGDDLFDKKDKLYQEYRRKWKQYPENFEVGGFPLFIDIEVTSICNLRCTFCSSTYRRNLIKKGFIDFEVVKKIIDEGKKEGLCGVKFNHRGEPLLHKQIHEFVKYAKNKGLIDVYYNTNAMLLDEENAKQIIESGLDRISISFEGYTKEIYEKYRVGAVYEDVLKNIKNLQDLKKKLGVKHPRVRVQAVMLPEVENDFENYKNFWSSIVDEVAYLDYREMKKTEQIVYPWACPQLWQRMLVLFDGTILPCNLDEDAHLSLGKIGDVSIKEAWNCQKLNNIREIHKIGNAHLVDACNECYLRNNEIKKLMDG